MIFTIGLKANTNGNIYRLVVDTEKKRYEVGYGVGTVTDIHARRKKEIDDFIKYTLKNEGYHAKITL